VNGGYLVRLVGEPLPERQRLLGKLNPHRRAGAGNLRDKRATGPVVHLSPATNPFYTVTVKRAGAEDSCLSLERLSLLDNRHRMHRGKADSAVAYNKLVKVRGHRVRFAGGFRGT